MPTMRLEHWPAGRWGCRADLPVLRPWERIADGKRTYADGMGFWAATSRAEVPLAGAALLAVGVVICVGCTSGRTGSPAPAPPPPTTAGRGSGARAPARPAPGAAAPAVCVSPT